MMTVLYIVFTKKNYSEKNNHKNENKNIWGIGEKGAPNETQRKSIDITFREHGEIDSRGTAALDFYPRELRYAVYYISLKH